MTASDQRYGPLEPFDRSRLAVPAPAAARALLGALLLRRSDDAPPQLVRIVETEAYREDDPASHSHAGRTARTEPMFWRPGTSYVYRSYGIHWCLNVAAEEEGIGAAVLLRAAVVVDGLDVIAARRPVAAEPHALLRGPGRLTQGLDIDGPRHDRGDVIAGAEGLTLRDDGWRPAAQQVVRGPRTGVRLGSDVLWRFFLAGERAVSSYRRSPRAPDPGR